MPFGPQAGEVRQRDIKAHPIARGQWRCRGPRECQLVLSIIPTTEHAVGSEIHQLDPECCRGRGRIGRPDVHVETRHCRGIDGLRSELDARERQVRVKFCVVADNLHIGHVGLIPICRPGINRYVGVGVAIKRNDIAGRNGWRGCGNGGAGRSFFHVHRHRPRCVHGTELGRDGRVAQSDGANHALVADGGNCRIGRSECEITWACLNRLVGPGDIESGDRSLNILRIAHFGIERLGRDGGPRVRDRAEALELHFIKPYIVTGFFKSTG